MSAESLDAWFYTCEGERIGPVTLAELRVKAQEASLNPRYDMVWTQGMAEWKPAGEIEGLFARRQAPALPADSLAPVVEMTASNPQQAVEAWMSKELDWPGAHRRSYFLATLLFPVAWQFIFVSSSGFLTQQFGEDIMAVAKIAAAFLPLIVIIYYGLLRLSNLGMSRWWILANLVPILNLWLEYRCFTCPAGYAYHKKLDRVGVALAVIYWLLIVVGLLVMVAAIALLFGLLDDPEMQEQLREIIRQSYSKYANL